jgi:hypothetical protein
MPVDSDDHAGVPAFKQQVGLVNQISQIAGDGHYRLHYPFPDRWIAHLRTAVYIEKREWFDHSLLIRRQTQRKREKTTSIT